MQTKQYEIDELWYSQLLHPVSRKHEIFKHTDFHRQTSNYYSKSSANISKLDLSNNEGVPNYVWIFKLNNYVKLGKIDTAAIVTDRCKKWSYKRDQTLVEKQTNPPFQELFHDLQE